MRISAIGCGYLGAVHAASMAKPGHELVGVDVDQRKVAARCEGRAPFYEPDFSALLQHSLASGRLSFGIDVDDAAGAQVHLICVGTPQKHGEYAADLCFVQAAAESLLQVLEPGQLVVGKSTVPVGTAAGLPRMFGEKVPGSLLAWNPEFLRHAGCR